MPNENPSSNEYRCPGETYSISREIHLGRMAKFYPACRQCPHREDVGSLSAKQIRQLTEVRDRSAQQSFFHEEGAGAASFNDLTPAVAHRMAIGLAASLANLDRDREETQSTVVAIAGDGRPQTAELVATVGEAIRWTGCEAIDIGAASSACLATAIDRLSADGGILLGSFGSAPHAVGVKFWGHGGEPLSRGGLLDRIAQLYEDGVDRPTRSYGPLRRFAAETVYLDGLTPDYHALRPLRVVLHSSCNPTVGYLQRLTESVACLIIACQGRSDTIGQQVLAEKAHFGMIVEDDGEIGRLFDDRGQPVPPERLLMLLVRSVPADAKSSIVLETGCSPALTKHIESLGHRVICGGALRAEMARAIRQSGATLGGGPSGRFWYSPAGLPLPDALRTLTRLLVLLSRSDRPLSAVLDDETPVE